ncbi:MAG: hypothetical protein JXA77_00425 [Bacteroidales bacterium]|nr:hypothetical protein [Bacteroidales bacterium]MBN2817638.1 hypothetical protein [Bacteroidales bacterium]
MKNKTTTYILVCLVAIIWGVVAFKIFNHIHQATIVDEEFIPGSGNSQIKLQFNEKPKLLLNYDDPFLKENVYQSNTKTTNRVVYDVSSGNISGRIKTNNSLTPKEEIIWPGISYSGIILNDKTHEELTIVEISDKTFLMREGEIQDEVELVKAYADSIIVEYKKKKSKTIFKSK